jgi:RNA polymerase sigma-70 factor (ECF subfamily)
MAPSRREHGCPTGVTTSQPEAGLSDTELVAQFLAGEEAAFTALVHRHGPRLHEFLRFVLGPRRDEAEDVAQDVFVQAFRSLASFRGQSSFRTWLYGIAKNVCRSRLSETRWTGHADSDAVLLELPDDALDPLGTLEREDLRVAVHTAIEELSPVHRSIVFLREIEGLAYDDIALALQVPIGTVRSRVHNARARLAMHLHAFQKVMD